MNIEPMFWNLAVSIGQFLFASVAGYCVLRFILKIKVHRHVFKGWGVALALLVWWNLYATNGPRFVLTDEAGSAPVVGGEVSTPEPRVMTDEQRLEYNRSLNEENAKE